MKPIDEKDLEALKEIQENNKEIIEKEEKIEQIIEEMKNERD